MIGTDQGVVLGCSRKAKCQAEYILNKSVWYHWSHLMIRLQVWSSLWTNQSAAEKPKLHQELPHHWRLECQGLVWGHQWKLSSCCQLRNWGCDFYLSKSHSSKWSQCLKFNFVDNSFSPFSPQCSRLYCWHYFIKCRCWSCTVLNDCCSSLDVDWCLLESHQTLSLLHNQDWWLAGGLGHHWEPEDSSDESQDTGKNKHVYPVSAWFYVGRTSSLFVSSQWGISDVCRRRLWRCVSGSTLFLSGGGNKVEIIDDGDLRLRMSSSLNRIISIKELFLN